MSAIPIPIDEAALEKAKGEFLRVKRQGTTIEGVSRPLKEAISVYLEAGGFTVQRRYVEVLDPRGRFSDSREESRLVAPWRPLTDALSPLDGRCQCGHVGDLHIYISDGEFVAGQCGICCCQQFRPLTDTEEER